jgi:pentatricopeptide repeat protein
MLASMFFEMGDVDGAFETWHEMDKRGCAQDVVETCILMIDWLFSYNKVEDACFPVEDIVKFPYQKFYSFLMQLSVIDNS